MGNAFYSYTKTSGVVNVIRPDGTQPAYDPKKGGFTGGGLIDSVWGLNVDGNDDVWVANIGAVKNGVVLMAGVDTKGHPPGTKTGDVIHLFRSGSIQLLTDTSIDPAGNVWAANNWNLPSAALDVDPVRRTSTWGGGSNFTVIYGVAAPVLPTAWARCVSHKCQHAGPNRPNRVRPGIRKEHFNRRLTVNTYGAAGARADDGLSGTMTRVGMVMGTLVYIGPEQAMDSHDVDIRADLYSLGCTLYFLLTSNVPFPGGEGLQKLMRHRLEEPIPVEQLHREVPPSVAAVVPY